MGRFLDGFLSLGKKINRVAGDVLDEQAEGIVGEKISQISLDKDDDELIELKRKWESKWENSKVKKEIEAKQQEAEKYWLGNHYTPAQRLANKKDLVDNLIFEAVETFLPVVTKQVAEPYIRTLPDPEAQRLAKKVSDKIVDIADVIRLRLKMKKAVRYWTLYFLGALKLGWSMEKDEIMVQAIRPQLLVLDPDAVTDECEYEGEYIGHYRTDNAEDLALRFPAKKSEIEKIVGKENQGTRIKYVEWWTEDYVFWTLKNEVLGKAKNPHWNYEEEVDVQIGMDEQGMPMMGKQKVPAKNHFSKRKIPFAFLSVFNLGTSPYDSTNLIEQVIPLQDVVNKRIRQIDKNADGTNGGAVVSGDFFSTEQAREVGEALRKGQTIRVPTGDINRAYKRDMAPALPNFIYQNYSDARQEIRGIFGTTGLSSQGIKSEDTVRGKILIKGQDSDRASLVIDHIEQLYDYIFNWFVQMMVVYYDTERLVTQDEGSETISSQDFVYPLVVSVKEGSLIPKDRLTMRNEAIDLWSAGALDTLTLAERLEVPDPEEFVRRLIMWKTNPVALLPQQDQLQLQGPEQFQEQPEQGEQNLLNQVPIQ